MDPYSSLAHGQVDHLSLDADASQAVQPYPRSQEFLPVPLLQQAPIMGSQSQEAAMLSQGGMFSSQQAPQIAAPYKQESAISPEELQRLYEGATDVQYGEKVLLHERVVSVDEQVTVQSGQQTIEKLLQDQREQLLKAITEAHPELVHAASEAPSASIKTIKPIYTIEKVIEVPQVIVKETEKYVTKPEIIERIIEVPKKEYIKKTYTGPTQVRYEEEIIEVPQIVYEERVIRVPGKRQVQERLIEVPKVSWVERVEYDDFVEYREVPVDKIVEVPEIEYRVREVEHLVPQTFVQEYFVDRYREVPVTQVQEVERIERVPVMVPDDFRPQGISSMNSQMAGSPSSQGLQARPSRGFPFASGGAFNSQPVQSSQFTSMPLPQPMQNVAMSYANYDPNAVSGTSNMKVGTQFLVPKGSMRGGLPGFPGGATGSPTPPGSGSGFSPFDSQRSAGNPAAFASMGTPMSGVGVPAF